MSRITRCLCGLVVVAFSGALVGCQSYADYQRKTVYLHYPHAHATTLSETSEEHAQKIRRVSAHDSRALMEDLDLLFQTERTTRLSRWHSR